MTFCYDAIFVRREVEVEMLCIKHLKEVDKVQTSPRAPRGHSFRLRDNLDNRGELSSTPGLRECVLCLIRCSDGAFKASRIKIRDIYYQITGDPLGGAFPKVAEGGFHESPLAEPDFCK